MAQHSARVPKPLGQASAPCPPALPTLSLTSKPPCSPVGSGRFEGYKEPKTQNPNMVPPSTLYTWWVSPRALHRLWLCREVPPQPPLAWWEPPALPCPALPCSLEGSLLSPRPHWTLTSALPVQDCVWCASPLSQFTLCLPGPVWRKASQESNCGGGVRWGGGCE